MSLANDGPRLNEGLPLFDWADTTHHHRKTSTSASSTAHTPACRALHHRLGISLSHAAVLTEAMGLTAEVFFD